MVCCCRVGTSGKVALRCLEPRISVLSGAENLGWGPSAQHWDSHLTFFSRQYKQAFNLLFGVSSASLGRGMRKEVEVEVDVKVAVTLGGIGSASRSLPEGS